MSGAQGGGTDMALSGNSCILPSEVIAKHLIRLEGMADILHRMATGDLAATDSELLFLAYSLKDSAEAVKAFSMTDAPSEC